MKFLALFSNRWGRRRLLDAPKLLGRWGEKRCERFLKRKGFKTLARNFSCKAGELDLVMANPEGAVVFVEVKTRTTEKIADAEASITPAKKSKLLRAAKYFAAQHEIESRPCRFDVVAIVLPKSGPAAVRHYENAFIP